MDKRFYIGGAFLVVLTAAAFLSNTELTHNQTSQTAPVDNVNQLAELPQVGYRAPDFQLTTFDGQTVKLSDLRGKPVVLNFWASWCGPCRFEMPDLQKAYDKYKGDVVFYGVNFSTRDTEEDALAMIKELGVAFPSLKDDTEAVFKNYQVVSIPSTYAIDKDGMIVEKRVGAISGVQIDGMFQRLAAK